jgi:hypothetical protein
MESSVPPSSSPARIVIRKRPRDDEPVFSSDPLEPSIDPAEKAPKRLYRGSWWDNSKSGKAFHVSSSLKRNFDSGIYMPSDDSLSSDPVPEFASEISSQNWPTQYQRSTRHSLSQSEESKTVTSLAEVIIDRALEESSEVFDLSDIELCEFEAHLVSKMQTLVTVPGYLHHDESYSPNEEEFRSLQPKMQLYLANNSLTSLPSTFWSLDSLTVLSLRNNGITELPGSIYRLVNLTELNVAYNALRWLPWELLSLLGPEKPLTKLHVLPNPFVQPVDQPESFRESQSLSNGTPPSILPRYFKLAMTKETWNLNIDRYIKEPASEDMPLTSATTWTDKLMLELQKLILKLGPKVVDESSLLNFHLLKSPLFAQHPVYLASSEVSRFSIDGSPEPGSASFRHQRGVVAAAPLHSSSSKESTVKSLFEQSVFVASQHDVDYRDLPQAIRSAMSIAQDSWDEGGRICSVCKKQYVIPRTEWLDYYYIAQSSLIISESDVAWPFLRRGCTFGCVRYQEDEKIRWA